MNVTSIILLNLIKWGGVNFAIINVNTKHQNIIGKNHKCPQPFAIFNNMVEKDALMS